MSKHLLAINGGKPVCTEPWPSLMLGPEAIGEEEIAAVTNVLRSKKIFRFLDIEHSRCTELEEHFKAMTGRKYALAVGGGTAALICGLIGIGVGEGDEVILPGYTYIASAAAVLICGGIPVIAEIDESLTLDPAAVESCITPRTKAIMPVHMRGYGCDMDAIMGIARKHNLLVIEDTAQACGGAYKGQRLGAIGNVGCYSLQQFKLITAGEGGMVVTDDETVYQRALLRHDSAMCFWQPGESKVNPFPGENFRMNEMEGALGCVQFGRLKGIIAKCHKLRDRLRREIADLDSFTLHHCADDAGDCGISQALLFQNGEKAKAFSAALQAEGIPCGSLYDRGIPDRHIYCHWEYVIQKYAADAHGRPWTSPLHDASRRYAPDMCPRTLDILGRTVMLSFSQTMDEAHADLMAKAIRKVCNSL